MTYVHWWGEGDTMKPETFVRDEVSGDLIEQMRSAYPPPLLSPVHSTCVCDTLAM